MASVHRVQANLKRYRAAVLKAACEGRLVPTEAEVARREGRSYETGGQLLRRILVKRQTRWSGRGNYTDASLPERADLPPDPGGMDLDDARRGRRGQGRYHQRPKEETRARADRALPESCKRSTWVSRR